LVKSLNGLTFDVFWKYTWASCDLSFMLNNNIAFHCSDFYPLSTLVANFMSYHIRLIWIWKGVHFLIHPVDNELYCYTNEFKSHLPFDRLWSNKYMFRHFHSIIYILPHTNPSILPADNFAKYK
jgi:hypothetical protein